jgi:hypothetical protein
MYLTKTTVPLSAPPCSFFCGEGPRSRYYGRTATLRLLVQPFDEDDEKDEQFLSWMKLTGETRSTRGGGGNLSQCHFVDHKSHMDWPGIEPGPPRWEPPEPWHGPPYRVISTYRSSTEATYLWKEMLWYVGLWDGCAWKKWEIFRVSYPVLMIGSRMCSESTPWSAE